MGGEGGRHARIAITAALKEIPEIPFVGSLRQIPHEYLQVLHTTTHNMAACQQGVRTFVPL
jgi:hypothetical protein